MILNNANDIRLGSQEVEKVYLGGTVVWSRSRERTLIYGWHLDPAIADPAQAVTYLADAVGKTPAAMGESAFDYGDWANAFFMPKPCMLRYDGTVAYYLDPNDYTKKADGTPSDVANAGFEGNAMMEWPLIWYKFEAGEKSGEGCFYCSNKQVDDSYHCWCNINAQDEITEHFYTAIYNGTGTSRLRSLSGVLLTEANGSGRVSGSTTLSRALANNVGAAAEWMLEVYCDRMLINALLTLISKSLDSQTAFGKGLSIGGLSAKEAYRTGDLDYKGLFWGNTLSATDGVKVFGMENWWGCSWHRLLGLVGYGNRYLYKLTYGKADGSSSVGYNKSGTGYISSGVSQPTGDDGIISLAAFTQGGILPIQISDQYEHYCSRILPGNNSAAFGGGPGPTEYSSTLNGAWALLLTESFDSDVSWSVGDSISCKPCGD